MKNIYILFILVLSIVIKTNAQEIKVSLNVDPNPNPEIAARHANAAQVFRAAPAQQELQKEDVAFAQMFVPAHCPSPTH